MMMSEFVLEIERNEYHLVDKYIELAAWLSPGDAQ